jgi:Polyketide cyclase / dehydrase and lipid transport
MLEIVSHKATSSASPSAFYRRWVDHASWSEWSPDTEWVRLSGPVQKGAHGTLKPQGGPKVKFVIKELRPDREYTDTNYLPGARLIFQHTAQPTPDGCELEVTVTMEGPLARVWALLIGKNFRKSVPEDLDRLIKLAEREA